MIFLIQTLRPKMRLTFKTADTAIRKMRKIALYHILRKGGEKEGIVRRITGYDSDVGYVSLIAASSIAQSDERHLHHIYSL